MKRIYGETYNYIAEMLKTSIDRGIKSSEVESRRSGLGDNKINILESKSGVIAEIFKIQGIYLVLQFLASIYLFMQGEEVLGGIAIMSFLILLYIKFILIKKNKFKFDYLNNINKATVEVIRDGKGQIIESEKVVIGDIIVFRKGSLIPADLRIIEQKELRVLEEGITGEKFLKEKHIHKITGNPSNIGEISNMLFKGSIIEKGEGLGIVVKVGMDTYLGKILNNFREKTFEADNIYEEFEKRITLETIGLIALSIILKISLGSVGRNFPIYECLFIIFLFPQTMVTYMQIEVIKKKFISREIEIKNPSVIKKVDNLNIMFLDKIGSVSGEEYSVKAIFTNLKIQEARDIAYGENINIKRTIDIISLTSLCREEIRDRGNIDFIKGLGEIRESIAFRNKEMFKIERESNKRFITTVNKVKKGYRGNSRGQLEDILKRCTHIMIGGVLKELREEERERIRNINYNFLAEGLVTEGLAYRNFEYKPSRDGNVESNLVFVGILALENKLYKDAKERMDKLKERGIVPILFTEDNKITATKIGIEVGIAKDKEEILTGVEIGNLSEEELIEVLSKVRVFSKINLETKGRIINCFIREGYKILSMGNSIGEISNLSCSNIGIAKGESLRIVKEVSDVVIEARYLEKINILLEVGSNFYKRLLEVNRVQWISVSLGILILAICGMFSRNDINKLILVLGSLAIGIINLISITNKTHKNRLIGINLIIFLIIGILK